MTKSPKTTKKNAVNIEDGKANLQIGRVRQLTISNFKAIGREPVSIDLDNIVVLVGPNNAGKSSILRAYELIMSLGNKAKITSDEFHEGKFDQNFPPTIELVSEAVDASDTWVHKDAQGNHVIKEKWVYDNNGNPTRSGWNAKTTEWDDKKPFGFDSVANKQRSVPHYIKPFDSPDEQAEEINKIVVQLMKEKAMAISEDGGEPGSAYKKLIAAFVDFQKKVYEETTPDIAELEKRVETFIADVFSGHTVKFDIDTNLRKEPPLFDGIHNIRIGPRGGYLSALQYQGSGTRRTALWSVLSVLAQRKESSRPHLLLLDEPEICLHPNTIREACRVLYDLAEKNNGWQAMITTHSPIFIDLSRNNTTVVRVERKTNGSITGTTLHKPEKAALADDDKDNLKLLTLYDPYLGEFFFGGQPIVVEGDTEYVAFRHAIEAIAENPYLSPISIDKLRDIQIIRARGKAPIVSVIKILNQFGAPYSVLHDADTKFITVTKKDGTPQQKSNPAWTINKTISKIVASSPYPSQIRHIVSNPNFESAYLDSKASGEKPYHAINQMKAKQETLNKIIQLLCALVDHSRSLPDGAIDGASQQYKDDINQN